MIVELNSYRYVNEFVYFRPENWCDLFKQWIGEFHNLLIFIYRHQINYAQSVRSLKK